MISRPKQIRLPITNRSMCRFYNGMIFRYIVFFRRSSTAFYILHTHSTITAVDGNSHQKSLLIITLCPACKQYQLIESKDRTMHLNYFRVVTDANAKCS